MKTNVSIFSQTLIKRFTFIVKLLDSFFVRSKSKNKCMNLIYFCITSVIVISCW